MEGGAWLRRSSSNEEGKFREAMGMACSSLQIEEMYPDQENALRAFLKEMISSSVRTKSISDPPSDPPSDLNKNTISLQNRKKTTAAGFRKQY